jgi:hypothetical protein
MPVKKATITLDELRKSQNEAWKAIREGRKNLEEYSERQEEANQKLRESIVEVKTTLRQEDIDDHILRMEKVRQHANKNGDTRQFLCAMAATVTDKSLKTYALNHGLFIIEPSGENIKVTKPPKERVW